MTLDEMALAVACVVGVDGGCSVCESYVIDRLVEAFPRFTVEQDGAEDYLIVTDEVLAETRKVRCGYGDRNEEPWKLITTQPA